MATTYEPDAWTVTAGTWGTDIDQSTSQSQVGGFSVEFKNTTPASNPTLMTDVIPAIPNGAYRTMARIKADSVAGGNNVYHGTNWYTAAQVFISTNYHYSTVLPSTNTWYEISNVVEAPATAAYRRDFVAKVNNAFTAYFDLAEVYQTPRTFHAYMTADTSIPASTWTRVVFDSTTKDIGSLFNAGSGPAAITAFADAGGGDVTVTSNGHGLSNDDWVQIYGTKNYNGNYVISSVAANTFDITVAWNGDDATGNWVANSYVEIPRSGFYDVSWMLTIDDLDDGELFGSALTVDGTSEFYGNQACSSGANLDIGSGRGLPGVWFDRGDKVSIYTLHNHGSALNLKGDIGALKYCDFTFSERL